MLCCLLRLRYYNIPSVPGRVMMKFGCVCVEAEDGVECIKQYTSCMSSREPAFDLVLMDFIMPSQLHIFNAYFSCLVVTLPYQRVSSVSHLYNSHARTRSDSRAEEGRLYRSCDRSHGECSAERCGLLLKVRGGCSAGQAAEHPQVSYPTASSII